jgi:hypothetical protein
MINWQELIAKCEELEIQASHFQNEAVPNQAISEQVSDTFKIFTLKYYEWYGECLNILPADLKAPFSSYYEGNSDSAIPCIKKFLEYPFDPKKTYPQGRRGQPVSDWRYPFRRYFYNPLQSQRQLLIEAKVRMLEEPLSHSDDEHEKQKVEPAQNKWLWAIGRGMIILLTLLLILGDIFKVLSLLGNIMVALNEGAGLLVMYETWRIAKNPPQLSKGNTYISASPRRINVLNVPLHFKFALVLAALLVIITGILLVKGGIILGSSPTSQSKVSSNKAATVQTSPVLTPISTASIPTEIAYNFQGGTQGWESPQAGHKQVNVSVAMNPDNPKEYALKIVTLLTGRESSSSLGRYTTVEVFFDQNIPLGFQNPGPYNLNGKLITCDVNLPQQLAQNAPPNQAYIRLFVEDTNGSTDYNEPLFITPNTTGKVQLQLTVGILNEIEPGFNGEQVEGMGIRIDVPKVSPLNYTGPFYVDECSMQH